MQNRHSALVSALEEFKVAEWQLKALQKTKNDPDDWQPIMAIYNIIAEYDSCNELTGVFYNERCLLHFDEENESVERPARCSEIYSELKKRQLLEKCRRVRGRKATKEEVCKVHTAPFYRMIEDTKYRRMGNSRISRNTSFHLDEEKDTYINDYSFDAARLSVGGLIEITSRVVDGTLKNGFAIIRPPGHHAEKCKAMGFCLFNNVAITAKIMMEKYDSVSKVMIVDWDVHHGNGTEKSFEMDPNVLYFSIHRYENGSFFPGTGKITSVGKGAGVGKTINVPLPGSGFGDTEYIQIFEQILIPVAREFAPDLLLVSAGFDSAYGDIGEMMVTEHGFAQMTSMLVNTGIVKDDNVVIALEGGYNIQSLVPSAMETVKVLLGGDAPAIPSQEEVYKYLTWTERKKYDITLRKFKDTLARVMTEQSRYWKCFDSMTIDAQNKMRATRSSAVNQLPRLHDKFLVFRNFVKGTTCPQYAIMLGKKIEKDGVTGTLVERIVQNNHTRWRVRFKNGTTAIMKHISVLKKLKEDTTFRKQVNMYGTIEELPWKNTSNSKGTSRATTKAGVKKRGGESKAPMRLKRRKREDFDLNFIDFVRLRSGHDPWPGKLPRRPLEEFDDRNEMDDLQVKAR
mmetsp:Transcript_19676/g.29376  ORF Transcript_19676/g.29376 Transcript_19676/m.29376 type:complete len:626 (+) Transcript_19676:112-1989(+)|eukprot:CAMPEP_0167742790 /NCGR_PEP_ID=MMETSP0110_2-20121227/1639_1 /TAXON_ID=629695 /ORGANISM="Gymnochlora sp., Strain CCMP2014" /LENGTH=625 /DNA_ID=CAMNT_0007627055 /DNA_START=37 /DNA_END=1914 /DNA_ORIENTATION=-